MPAIPEGNLIYVDGSNDDDLGVGFPGENDLRIIEWPDDYEGISIGDVDGDTNEPDPSGDTDNEFIIKDPDDTTPDTVDSAAGGGAASRNFLDVRLWEGLTIADGEPYKLPTKEPEFIDNYSSTSFDWIKLGDNFHQVEITNTFDSSYLMAQGFSFELPEGSEISGIEVSFDYNVSYGGPVNFDVDLAACGFSEAIEGEMVILADYSTNLNNDTDKELYEFSYIESEGSYTYIDFTN
jgi:hypothetical protein